MNTDGFTEFVACHRSALFRMALALTADRASAEDLVQEALTRTVSRWSKVVRNGDPAWYVRTVMLNAARSQWRRRARRPELITNEPPEPTASDDDQRQAAQRVDIQNLLKQLSPRQRAIIYLRYCEDMSVADTAALINCSPGTIKRQTFDALKRIRKIAPELLSENATEPDSR